MFFPVHTILHVFIHAHTHTLDLTLGLDISVIPSNEVTTTHDSHPQNTHRKTAVELKKDNLDSGHQTAHQKLSDDKSFTKFVTDNVQQKPPPSLVPRQPLHAKNITTPYPRTSTEHAHLPTFEVRSGDDINLSTITEESENYKSSTCSSRSTISSGSSRFGMF